MSTYNYPRDMISPLTAVWPRQQRHEGPNIPPLPPEDTLLEILETAYHASFTADEQRGTRFAAIVCHPRDAEAPIAFASPRDLTTHELMRLAPVAHAEDTMIGISAPAGSNPFIWGICSDSFMQLRISVRGPGLLAVGRNSLTLVALRGGRVEQDSLSRGFAAMASFLQSANAELLDSAGVSGESAPEQTVYPAYLHTLAGKIAQAGHGGAIILVREADAERLLHEKLLRVKYNCDDDSVWRGARLAISGSDESVDERARQDAERAEAEIERLLSRIARLASVDGAVLMTERFRLLGFGCEVTAPALVDEVERDDRTIEPVDAFGTRHRSAFRFSSAYPEGLAIVCSQDGGIKCVYSREGRVHLSER